MSLLGKPQGIFSIKESDKYVGSFISRSEVNLILGTTDQCLDKITFKVIEGGEYIDEKSLRDSWQKGEILNSPPQKIGNSSISLDEYILVSIIRNTFPELSNDSIEQQIRWGKKYIDIKITLNGEPYFIEFHGPGHFSRTGIKPPEDPMQRKYQIEKDFGIKCFIWPYWIQRCSRNLRILLGIENGQGFGALWSTKVFFGDFYFYNSYRLIKEITEQFNADLNGTYGYFYERDGFGRIKPEHPIVESILKGRTKGGINKLLPPGIPTNEINNWLPKKLINHSH